MKTLARPALRSAATSISTMAGVRIRALTERHPIKPTSPRCHAAWQLNLGRHSTYRRGKSVQTTGTTSIRTRAYLQRVFRWHADGSDDYRAPSMRARGKANERDRILGEDEVRSFWRASVSLDHPFSHMLRFILLTATRRDEAADMRWTELEEDEGGAGDIWLIPAARYKTKANFEIPLSKAAQVVLREAGRIKLGTAGYVFTTNGDAPISGFSKWKAHFDGLMLAERRKIAVAYGDDA